MIRKALVLGGLLIGLLATDARAQRPGQTPPARYQPSRPTVSPYLNLFRQNEGPLPNYHSLVRPQLQNIENERRQQAINIQQQTEIRTLNRGLSRIAQPAAASTGGGGTFRNFSHYYPSMGR
jgi:hypothetical protein